MVIGVFIAPILLYWEALSSEFQAKATFSAAQMQNALAIEFAGIGAGRRSLPESRKNQV